MQGSREVPPITIQDAFVREGLAFFCSDTNWRAHWCALAFPSGQPIGHGVQHPKIDVPRSSILAKCTSAWMSQELARVKVSETDKAARRKEEP